MKRTFVLSIAVFVSITSLVLAEVVRDGIDIDFVTIGNVGNMGDTLVMYDGTAGYGAVSYKYRIGKYEVTNAQWNDFTAAAGIPTGNLSNAYDESASFTGVHQPTNMVSWYEAAQFCNFLTSGDKGLGAYQFSGNNTNPGNFLGINRAAAQTTYGTIYVIPTEDEWYKAAYYNPNGSGYSLYSNGLNTIPAADNGWNYGGGSYNEPWNVGTGLEEQNGTFDMIGNVIEWNENLLGSSGRSIRGGDFYSYAIIHSLISSWRDATASTYEWNGMGFRVASVPEPASLLLLGLGGLLIRKR
jgi:formylglycine-generating enzyme required for sulfatase activity